MRNFQWHKPYNFLFRLIFIGILSYIYFILLYLRWICIFLLPFTISSKNNYNMSVLKACTFYYPLISSLLYNIHFTVQNRTLIKYIIQKSQEKPRYPPKSQRTNIYAYISKVGHAAEALRGQMTPIFESCPILKVENPVSTRNRGQVMTHDNTAVQNSRPTRSLKRTFDRDPYISASTSSSYLSRHI